MKKLALFLALLLLALAPRVASAQCSVANSMPQFTLGGNAFGATMPQWRAFFAAKVDANNGSLCGATITQLPAPINPGDAATKQYVDNLTTPIFLHPPVALATNGSASFTGSISGTTLTVSSVKSGAIGPNQALTATSPNVVSAGTRIVSGSGTSWVVNNSQSVGSATMTSVASLPTNTYSNGTGGVGATLTGQVNGALSIDGTAVTAGTRVLVKDEFNSANNGAYVVTATGSVSAVYVLTRATDYNTGTCIISGPTCVTPNSYFLVLGGQLEQSSGWVMTTQGAITVGVSPLVFQQFAAANPGLGYTPLNPVNNLSDVSSITSARNNLIPSGTLLAAQLDPGSGTVGADQSGGTLTGIFGFAGLSSLYGNGLIGQINNDLAANSSAEPAGLTGYGRLTTNGNQVLGVFGLGECRQTLGGICVGAEATVTNYTGNNPDTNLPPNTAAGTSTTVPVALNVTAGTGAGTKNASIGLNCSNVSGLFTDSVFNTCIYVAGLYAQYGLYVDAPPSGTQTGMVIASNGNGTNLHMTTPGTTPNNAVMDIQSTGAGTPPIFSVRQNGDVYVYGTFHSAGVGSFQVPSVRFGSSLANQLGNTSSACFYGDWASQLIPNSMCLAVADAATSPGFPFASASAARLSDSSAYGFATLALGINDNPVGAFALETEYNETREYYGATATLAKESDIINSGTPDNVVAQITPYSVLPSGKSLIVNQWLTNGRPDLLYLVIGKGIPSAGDVFTATFTGGYSGSPQTISTTATGGDTTYSIIGKLAAAFNANSVLTTAGMSAATVPQSASVATNVPNGLGEFVSIAGAPLPSVMTTTFTASGSEIAVVSYGGNASAMVVGINNSNRNSFGPTAGTGQAYTGITFQCDELVGADCTDTGGYGEYSALSRGQSIDFYSHHTPGGPQSRIASLQTSPTVHGLNLIWRDGHVASFEDENAVPAASITPTVFYREGVESVGSTVGATGVASGATVTMADTTEVEIIQPSGSLTTLTVQLPDCNSSYALRKAQFVSTQAISALTVTAASGSVNSAPSSLAPGVGPSYICAGGGLNIWYRLN